MSLCVFDVPIPTSEMPTPLIVATALVAVLDASFMTFSMLLDQPQDIAENRPLKPMLT